MKKSMIEDVFAGLKNTVVIPNVRDAVRGLQGDSGLVGPVEFYGDRSIVMPSYLIAIKSPRDVDEDVKIKNHFAFLRDMGIGAKNYFSIDCSMGGSSGIVDRLLSMPKNKLVGILSGKKLQFFIDTAEADQLVSALDISKIGSSADVCSFLNNKINQREIASVIDEEIFPPYVIASTEEEVRQGFRKISSLGVVLGKIGHLASGEGMEELMSEDHAIAFFMSWLPVLKKHHCPEKIIIELKMKLKDDHNSTSVQFFIDDSGARYLGTSVQYIGDTGFVHEGNKIGPDIYSQLGEEVEDEMIRKSLLVLDLCSGVRGFIGFDYILCQDGEVLMTEINLRGTASTILYALASQITGGMSFDIKKIHVGANPKMGLDKFLRNLEKFNNPSRIVLPLNGRLFDKTGDMFVTVCARTFDEIEETRKEFLSWF